MDKIGQEKLLLILLVSFYFLTNILGIAKQEVVAHAFAHSQYLNQMERESHLHDKNNR